MINLAMIKMRKIIKVKKYLNIEFHFNTILTQN